MNSTAPNTCPRCNSELSTIPQAHPCAECGQYHHCPVCDLLSDRLPAIIADIANELCTPKIPLSATAPTISPAPLPDVVDFERNQPTDADKIHMHAMGICLQDPMQHWPRPDWNVLAKRK